MAAMYACLHEKRLQKLILLAPALHLEPYDQYRDKKLHMPVIIFHGLQDDVVPIESVRTIAQHQFTDCIFHAVEDDHSLHSTFVKLEWNSLFELQDPPAD